MLISNYIGSMSDIEVVVNKNEYIYTFRTQKSISWFIGYFNTSPHIKYWLIRPIIRKYNQTDEKQWTITYTTESIQAKTDNIEIEYNESYIILKYIDYMPDTYIFPYPEHIVPPRNKKINMTLKLEIQYIAKYYYDLMCGIIPEFNCDVIKFSPTLLALYYDLIIQQIKTDKEYIYFSKNCSSGCGYIGVKRYSVFNEIVYKWQCLINSMSNNIEILEICENKMTSSKKIQFDSLQKWSDNVWREIFAKVLCELVFMPNVGIMYQKASNHYQKMCNP